MPLYQLTLVITEILKFQVIYFQLSMEILDLRLPPKMLIKCLFKIEKRVERKRSTQEKKEKRKQTTGKKNRKRKRQKKDKRKKILKKQGEKLKKRKTGENT